MNSAPWLAYFQKESLAHFEADWHLPVALSAAQAQALAASLARYQLGESGDGTVLLKDARRIYPCEDDYCAALASYIRVEGLHAQLLDRLVHHLGGQTLARHWTHSLFRLIRRALGARFEIEVLAIAEIVGTAYYRLLHRHVPDPVVQQVCAQLLHDEARHLDFHGERLAADQRGWGLLAHALWAWRFRALVLCAGMVAWLDHGEVLRAFGGRRREFQAEARRECSCLLAALARSAEALLAEESDASLPLKNPTLRTS
jgi:hypothetical protein